MNLIPFPNDWWECQEVCDQCFMCKCNHDSSYYNPKCWSGEQLEKQRAIVENASPGTWFLWQSETPRPFTVSSLY